MNEMPSRIVESKINYGFLRWYRTSLIPFLILLMNMDATTKHSACRDTTYPNLSSFKLYASSKYVEMVGVQKVNARFDIMIKKYVEAIL